MFPVSGLYINDNIYNPGPLDFTPVERALARRKEQERFDDKQKLEYYQSLQPTDRAILPEDQPLIRQKGQEYMDTYAKYIGEGLNLQNPKTSKERYARQEVDRMKREAEGLAGVAEQQKKDLDMLLKRRNEQPDQYDVEEFDPSVVEYRKLDPLKRMEAQLALNPRIDRNKLINDVFGKATPSVNSEIISQGGRKFIQETKGYSPEQVQAFKTEFKSNPDTSRLINKEWNKLNEDQKKQIGTKENFADAIIDQEIVSRGGATELKPLSFPPQPREEKPKEDETKLIFTEGVKKNYNYKKKGEEDNVKSYVYPGELTFSGKRLGKTIEASTSGAISLGSRESYDDPKLAVGTHPMVVTGVVYAVEADSNNKNDKDGRVVKLLEDLSLIETLKNPKIVPYVTGRLSYKKGGQQKDDQVMVPYKNLAGTIEAAYGVKEEDIESKRQELENKYSKVKEVPMKGNSIDFSKINKSAVYNYKGIKARWNGKNWEKAD